MTISRLSLGDRREHGPAVAHVGLDLVDALADAGQLVQRRRRRHPLGEAGHARAELLQPQRQPRALEARVAGDEDRAAPPEVRIREEELRDRRDARAPTLMAADGGPAASTPDRRCLRCARSSMRRCAVCWIPGASSSAPRSPRSRRSSRRYCGTRHAHRRRQRDRGADDRAARDGRRPRRRRRRAVVHVLRNRRGDPADRRAAGLLRRRSSRRAA